MRARKAEIDQELARRRGQESDPALQSVGEPGNHLPHPASWLGDPPWSKTGPVGAASRPPLGSAS